jgi:NaMN:DMB phosphoribosyltransferase
MNGFINVAALGESRRDFGDPRRWVVSAHEHVPTDKEWELDAFAFCASARP